MSVYPAPIDFDPATHPILSLHWFGAERSIQAVNDQKFNTYAELDPEALEVAGGLMAFGSRRFGKFDHDPR